MELFSKDWNIPQYAAWVAEHFSEAVAKRFSGNKLEN